MVVWDGGGVLLWSKLILVGEVVVVVQLVGSSGWCWCEQMIREVVRWLKVVFVSLLVAFCGGQRFPYLRVAWSLGGLGFFVVLDGGPLFVGGVFRAWSLGIPFGEWSRG